MTVGLTLSHKQFSNDVAEELRLFFPDADVVLDSSACDAALTVTADHEKITAVFRAQDGRVFQDELPCPVQAQELLQKRHLKRAYKLTAYRALKAACGRPSPWGALTGIRPTKFARGLLEEVSDVQGTLLDVFDLTKEKAALLQRVLETQRGLLHDGSGIDVYIGVPFCASRCSYCSFAAEVPRHYARVEAYLDALFREIDACAEDAGRLVVRSVYIGGGTPTSLGPRDFERLLSRAAALSPVREFAVEAGRPDTLDAEKLALMQRYAVTRTSVNPQTMSDETLLRIGRGHTSADIVRAFALTREHGLPVNADIIVGLPGETRKDVARTLDALGALAPEGFTAHTLALKRASRMVMSGESDLPDKREAEAMLSLTQEWAQSSGMNPYYLYRQKYMAGNLENVGYAKPGYECLYNIDIMEETTSILAFGAGAITKWIFGGGRLERQPNPKDIDTYVAKTPELIRRKLAWLRGHSQPT